MSTTSVSDVLRDIYSAPLEAAVRAEEDYRRIWALWLRKKLDLLKSLPKEGADVDLAELLRVAPVVRMDGRMDVAITLRIASVKERQGNVSAGLQLGPVHASGSFGFMSRSTQESVFQASTVVMVSNTEQNLGEYLAQHKLQVTNAKELENAIAFLEGPKKPAVAPVGG